MQIIQLPDNEILDIYFWHHKNTKAVNRCFIFVCRPSRIYGAIKLAFRGT